MIKKTILGICVVVFAFGFPIGTSVTAQTEAQTEAKLEACYDLLNDISDDFGWFWQQTKRTNYNAMCGELTGYISEKG
jgi:uncharacterized protein YmfQ (DUF2313 family)